MNDQRSLLDQLRELAELANKNGLYDAADFVFAQYEASVVEKPEILDTEQQYKPDLEAIIFDFMVDCEVKGPSIKETLEKWVKEFPQYEKELREYTEAWRQMVKRGTKK